MPDIRITCGGCGEDSEVTYDPKEFPDTIAAAVTPCQKCLKSQAENLVEEVEEQRKTYNSIFKDDNAMDSAMSTVIAIIQKRIDQ